MLVFKHNLFKSQYCIDIIKISVMLHNLKIDFIMPDDFRVTSIEEMERSRITVSEEEASRILKRGK